MRVLMIAGVAGRAEAGGAGVVHNVATELRNVGHTVKPMFFEDLLPKQRWPARFRTVEFAARVSRYVTEVRNEYDVVNIYAPHGFWYGFRRRQKGSAAGPPYVMSMHGTIPGDADSLAVALSTLYGNSQLRHELGCAAQEKMKRFTWKLSALRHEAVFRRAMGVKPVPVVPEPEETTIGGGSYSGKVILS